MPAISAKDLAAMLDILEAGNDDEMQWRELCTSIARAADEETHGYSSRRV